MSKYIMPKLEIQRIPVRCETHKKGISHVWAPIVGNKIVQNPNDEGGLFLSIKSAKAGIARYLRLGADDAALLEISVRK